MHRPVAQAIAAKDSCALLLEQLGHHLASAASEVGELSLSPLELSFSSLEWLDEGTLLDLREVEGQHLAIRQPLEGALSGEVVWIAKEADARRLVRLLTGVQPGKEPLGYTEREALTEVGNLLLLGLVEGLADTLGVAVAAGPPALRLGSATRLLPDEGSGGICLRLEAQSGGAPLPGYLVLILSSLSAVFFDRHLRVLADRGAPPKEAS